MNNSEANWDDLPDHLQYIIPWVEKYGRYTTEEEILDYLETISSSDQKDIEAIRIKFDQLNDHDEIIAWIDSRDASRREANMTNSFYLLLDHAID